MSRAAAGPPPPSPLPLPPTTEPATGKGNLRCSPGGPAAAPPPCLPASPRRFLLARPRSSPPFPLPVGAAPNAGRAGGKALAPRCLQPPKIVTWWRGEGQKLPAAAGVSGFASSGEPGRALRPQRFSVP